MIRHVLCFLAALAALLPCAHAHDFWIEPSTFRPAVGAKLEFDLRVGERFTGEPVVRRSDRVQQFFALDPSGARIEIPGVDGRAPAGIWRPADPGLHVVGYRGVFVPIELEARKFESYLREEGLEHVIAARAARGESDRPGREAYARNAKSFVVVAPKDPAARLDLRGTDRVLGFPLEIVPLVNPLDPAAPAQLSVRVLFQGRPLKGALVGCLPKSAPEAEARLRTDAEGRVVFDPRHGGVHLLRVVWMERAAEGAPHDWESWWASLTYEFPAR